MIWPVYFADRACISRLSIVKSRAYLQVPTTNAYLSRATKPTSEREIARTVSLTG
jgi:hypothetical protein